MDEYLSVRSEHDYDRRRDCECYSALSGGSELSSRRRNADRHLQSRRFPQIRIPSITSAGPDGNCSISSGNDANLYYVQPAWDLLVSLRTARRGWHGRSGGCPTLTRAEN